MRDALKWAADRWAALAFIIGLIVTQLNSNFQLKANEERDTKEHAIFAEQGRTNSQSIISIDTKLDMIIDGQHRIRKALGD